MPLRIVSVHKKQKPTEIREEIDKPIIIRNFNILFSVTDRTSREAHRDIEDLNNTISQTDLTDIYIKEEIIPDWLETNVLNKPLNSGKRTPQRTDTTRRRLG